VAYRSIELGPKLEGLRIVRSGLSKGEKIVVNGLQRAMPGSTVDPQPVSMADDSTLERLARMRQAVDGSQAPRIAAEKIEARSPRG